MTVNTETIDFGAIDYSDPCAVLALMKPCYYQLVAGARAQTVTFDADLDAEKLAKRVQLAAVGIISR